MCVGFGVLFQVTRDAAASSTVIVRMHCRNGQSPVVLHVFSLIFALGREAFLKTPALSGSFTFFFNICVQDVKSSAMIRHCGRSSHSHWLAELELHGKFGAKDVQIGKNKSIIDINLENSIRVLSTVTIILSNFSIVAYEHNTDILMRNSQ